MYYSILLWDSLEDIKMIRKEERDNTVAIWFCTSNRRHQIEEFMRVFDIVIKSDNDDGEVGEMLMKKLQH